MQEKITEIQEIANELAEVSLDEKALINRIDSLSKQEITSLMNYYSLDDNICFTNNLLRNWV